VSPPAPRPTTPSRRGPRRSWALALALGGALLGGPGCGDRECEVLDVICVEACGGDEFLQCTSCPEGSAPVDLCPEDGDDVLQPNGCGGSIECALTCAAGEACVCGDDPGVPSGCVPASCADAGDCAFGLRCELARAPTAEGEPAGLRCRTRDDACIDSPGCPVGTLCTTVGAEAPWNCLPLE